MRRQLRYASAIWAVMVPSVLCTVPVRADPLGPAIFNGPGWTTWTAPVTATYQFIVDGSDGGDVIHPIENDGYGGLGAQVIASFRLTQGTTLAVVVGGKGGDGPSSVLESGSAGGGGASVVYNSFGIPIIIAGGGGGAGSDSGQNGLDASTTSTFMDGALFTSALSGVNAGTNAGTGGNGGGSGGGSIGGGGGGGLFTAGGNGQSDGSYGAPQGGKDLETYADGFTGVSGTGEGGDGGYNGGGGGVDDYGIPNGSFGGGGGGGYSGGGGGGADAHDNGDGGGAGGSFSADGFAQFYLNNVDPTGGYGTADGNGRIEIEPVAGVGAAPPSPVPEPSSLLLSASGLLGLAAAGVRKLSCERSTRSFRKADA